MTDEPSMSEEIKTRIQDRKAETPEERKARQEYEDNSWKRDSALSYALKIHDGICQSKRGATPELILETAEKLFAFLKGTK